jgi:hypothetical protein
MVNVIDVDLEPCLSEAKSLASFVWAVADRRGRKPNTYDENEYKAAWIACVHIAQREYFRLEIAALERGKPLPRSSSLLKLALSIDSAGILKSRWTAEKCSFESRCCPPGDPFQQRTFYSIDHR